jgi:paraquat-inducible protein B
MIKEVTQMSTQLISQPGESILSRMLTRIRNAISRWREMRSLDSREIEAVARELNISAAELVTLMSTSDESIASLNKRLANAGLSEAEIAKFHAEELRDLRRVCSQCTTKAKCARDLRHNRLAAVSKYCPNELTLRALADEAPREGTAPATSSSVRPV